MHIQWNTVGPFDFKTFLTIEFKVRELSYSTFKWIHVEGKPLVMFQLVGRVVM